MTIDNFPNSTKKIGTFTMTLIHKRFFFLFSKSFDISWIAECSAKRDKSYLLIS
ncbi:hypothetical protein Hanom_Chr02g00147941 [Helianthus anomalus]